ncbi:hypoxanthine phosphoribosyltransferase [Anaerobranca gottschalkii]|uniref:Hypoxanthine phosphoribosyltransferase n=1 Tax=Anaerobranca gottschalkii DSM 13577 TaxID=1120990 RepID=A0A1I0AYJ1_9FIRM|nr:hypoxanthine phosphoribosyltransferase [Anaerobranca gottschalkii]SES98710.1 hypoxanthine phosphoribosyltransferase [Anaerobranca gottschalkii DSM 13577]
MEKVVERILISEEEIQQKVKELGQQLSNDYKGKDVLFICVLKGAIMFMSDLSKAMSIPIEMDFMAVSSYGASTKSSGIVKIIKDLDASIEDKHVVVIEDIIDTGLTLSYLIKILQNRKPASLKICTLLDKPARRTVDIKPDYSGFVIDDHFVVGYGLDYDEKYRNIPYIFIPKGDIIK